MKLVSEEWRNLSSKNRTVWDKLAEDNKKRYEVEKKMYTGPWKIPASKRAKKDPNSPKRPMSEFLAFSKKMRTQVKSENSHLSNTDVSKLLETIWKSSSEVERSIHIIKESEEREVYKVAISKWRAEDKEKNDSQLKQPEDIEKIAIANGATIRSNMPSTGQIYPPYGYSYGPPPGAAAGNMGVNPSVNIVQPPLSAAIDS